jgi:hypothetical protein
MLFAVALLWCGCSKIDNESVAPDDDARLIGVSASTIDVIASPSTRAALNAIPGDGLSAQVLATKNEATGNGDYTSLYCDGTMKFNNSTDVAYYHSVTEGSKKWYPTDQDWVYLSGLYPATGWDVDNIGSYGRVVFDSMDGKTDLMYAGDVKSTMFSSSAATLEFKHLLTQLKFKLNTPIDNKSVVVKTIKLIRTGAQENDHEFPIVCRVKLNNTDDVEFIYTGFGDTELFGYLNDDTKWDGLAIDVQENKNVVKGYVLAPSLTAIQVSSSAVDYKLEVTYRINNDPYITRYAKINLRNSTDTADYADDTKGKSFEVTLNFNQEITAKATIAEWTDGGIASAPVE